MQFDNVKFFIFVIIIGTIGQISAEITAPSLPYICRDLAISQSFAQFIISYYLLGMAVPAIVFGVLADAFGRREILIISSMIGLCGSIACCCASNIYVIILGRVIQGIGFGGIAGISATILRDRYKGIKFAQYMSYLSVAFSLSIDLAPFIGGFVQARLSWRMIFVLVLLHNVMVLYLSFKYKETYQPIRAKFEIKHISINIISIMTNRNFAIYTFVGGLMYAIFMSYIIVATFIIQDILHRSSIYYGVVTICLSMVFALSSFVNGRLLSTFSISYLINFGFLLTIISGIILSFIPSRADMLWFIIAVLPMFIGSAFVFANTSSLSFASIKSNLGMASSVNFTIRLLLGFLVTSIVGYYHKPDTFILGLTIGISSVIALIVLLVKKVLYT